MSVSVCVCVCYRPILKTVACFFKIYYKSVCGFMCRSLLCDCRLYICVDFHAVLHLHGFH